MTLLQKSLPSFLCCVLAIGYAPAWLHVSICHDHHATGDDVETAEFSCLGSCSHAHASASHESDAAGSQGAEGQPSEQQHDSDTCFVCQSLGNANGLTPEWDIPLQSTSFCEPTSIPNEFTFVGPCLLIAEARGPPSLV
jgi:hypothetical protein